MLSLGNLLIDMGEYAEAEVHLKEVMNATRRSKGPNRELHQRAINGLRMLHEQWNQKEPGEGHAAMAEQYRQLFEQARRGTGF